MSVVGDLTRERIEAMVREIDPTAEVRDATPATPGHHLVVHLTVTAESLPTAVVLKATPPGASPSCGAEARMLQLVDAHTELPVPTLQGVVDTAPEYPTPYFLASSVPGARDDRTVLREWSDEDVASLARSTGAHLATLHELDALDGYGYVTVESARELEGGRPAVDREQLVVETPESTWREYLAAERERILPGLADTRFADLQDPLGPVLDAAIEALTGPFEPVIARVDHSLGNVVVDPDSKRVRGLLDWEFCVAATPAYDLAFVEHSLVGGPWGLLPAAPDHRQTIREAMCEGYATAGSPAVVEQFRTNRSCYDLLADVHAMLNLEGWFETVDVVEGTEAQRSAVASALRDCVTRRV